MKVLIAGEMFDREEKEPFVISGESLYGALEYDFQRDLLKCHECGVYIKGLSQHIITAHDMTTRFYKNKHGLRYKTGLVSQGVKRRMAEAAVRHDTLSVNRLKRTGNSRKEPIRNMNERRNLTDKCRAQLSLKINTLARQLGRTPTILDLRQNSIGERAIKGAFGVRHVSGAMVLIGLEPRKAGGQPLQDITVL